VSRQGLEEKSLIRPIAQKSQFYDWRVAADWRMRARISGALARPL
jgi:hypothetical protein